MSLASAVAPSTPGPGEMLRLDDVSQMQEHVDALASAFTDAIGILQAEAPAESSGPAAEAFAARVDSLSASVLELATTIHRCAGELPGISRSEAEQLAVMKELQEENEAVGIALREKQKVADELLLDVREATRTVCTDYLTVALGDEEAGAGAVGAIDSRDL